MEVYGNTQSDPNLQSEPLTGDDQPVENDFVVKLPDENYASYVGRAGAAGVDAVVDERSWNRLPVEGEKEDGEVQSPGA